MISPVFMIQALGRSRLGFERSPAPIRRPRRSFTFSHSVLENACRSSKLYWSLKPPLTKGYLKQHVEASPISGHHSRAWPFACLAFCSTDYRKKRLLVVYFILLLLETPTKYGWPVVRAIPRWLRSLIEFVGCQGGKKVRELCGR